MNAFSLKKPESEGLDEDDFEDEQPQSSSAQQNYSENVKSELVLKVSQFSIDMQDFGAYSTLHNKDISEITVRAELLLKVNMVFLKLFKFVNHASRHDEDTNHGKHYALKSFILPTVL